MRSPPQDKEAVTSPAERKSRGTSSKQSEKKYVDRTEEELEEQEEEQKVEVP